MDIIRGNIKSYEDIEAMLREDEFINDDDRTWWEGVVYGCYLCGVISLDEKYELVDLIEEIMDKNIEVMNNGGEEIE